MNARSILVGLISGFVALALLPSWAMGQCEVSFKPLPWSDDANDMFVIDGFLLTVAGETGLVLHDQMDQDRFRFLGSLRFDGLEAARVVAETGMAYVAVEQTIHAVDISVPVYPRTVGSIQLGDTAQRLILRGSTLYVAAGSYGLAVIDVGDPSSPTLLSRVPSASSVRDVDVSGDLCYVVTDGGSLVLDVSDPGSPAVLVSNAFGTRSVALFGNIAFVTDTASIRSYDLSVPQAPVLLEDNWPGSVSNSVRIIVDHPDLYVMSSGVVMKFDISEPDDPVYSAHGTACASDDITALAAMGDGKALVATGDQVVRVRDNGTFLRCRFPPPLFPEPGYRDSRLVDGYVYGRRTEQSFELVVSSFEGGTFPSIQGSSARAFQNVQSIAVDPVSRAAYVQSAVRDEDAGEDIGIRSIHRFANMPYFNMTPYGPQGNPWVEETDPYSISQWIALRFYSGLLYSITPQPYGPLQVLEPGSLSPTLRIDSITSYDLGGMTPNDLLFVDDRLLVSVGDAGILVLDPDNLGSPGPMQTIQTPGHAQRLAVSGDLLLVADTTGGVIINISDMDNPVTLAEVALEHSVEFVQVRGRMAALGDSAVTTLVDITDPSAPRVVTQINESLQDSFLSPDQTTLQTSRGYYELGSGAVLRYRASAPTAGTTFGVSFSGNYAFVSDYFGGVRIFDVSDIASPFEVGAYDTPDRAYETVVVGNLAYVVDGATGLVVLDVSDPASPTLVGSLALSDLAIGLAVDGDFAYVATRFDGLQILDITNPASPVLVGAVDTPGSAQSVTVDGNIVYVADGSGGVQVVDVTARSSPNIVGSYNTPSSARQVLVRGLVAYVPDRTTGLIALDISDPTNPQLISTLAGLGDTRGVTAWGHLAFVADFAGFVHMVDIADPGDMQLLQSVASVGTPRAISNDGRVLYLADGDAGLTIFDAQPCWYNPCPADIIDDGLLDFFDLQAFLNAYSAGDGLADWNDDGLIDFFDLQQYLNDYSDGCP